MGSLPADETDKLLRSYLRQACRQIKEFRSKCDPREEHVLVTAVEMCGEDSFSDTAEWFVSNMTLPDAAKPNLLANARTWLTVTLHCRGYALRPTGDGNFRMLFCRRLRCHVGSCRHA